MKSPAPCVYDWMRERMRIWDKEENDTLLKIFLNCLLWDFPPRSRERLKPALQVGTRSEAARVWHGQPGNPDTSQKGWEDKQFGASEISNWENILVNLSFMLLFLLLGYQKINTTKHTHTKFKTDLTLKALERKPGRASGSERSTQPHRGQEPQGGHLWVFM